MAEVSPGARVLDVGAGIGGSARTLARHFDATVTALDPTSRFCDLNEDLNRRAGLADKVAVVRGDGREMPFADGEFDLAVTQALWQSVEDKAAGFHKLRWLGANVEAGRIELALGLFERRPG